MAPEQQRGTTPGPKSGVAAGRSYPCLRPEVAAGKSYTTPEVRGGSLEEQPHIQGAVAARAREGREELLHFQGQEGQR